MGSVLARLQGPADPAMPAYVGLAPKMGHVPWSDNGRAGYLGPACAPFEINKGGGKDDMVLNGVTLDRLSDRLASEGGPAEDWTRLVTALGVLGETGRAKAAYASAREALAGDEAALAALRTAAEQAGVAE